MTIEPQQIGRYTVQKVLGRGAMGVVYLAHDPVLQRPVAIKVVLDPIGGRSQIMARFQREAVISAKLNHPHIITIFDVSEDPVMGPFMAMEYIDGASLSDLIREKVPLERGLRLLNQTMSALVASESAGITHRDVKPDNILVGKDWRVKLMDFGIARGDEARLSQAGMIFGTPYYTAPEVLVGEEASWVADRYSFAVTAFELISGELPFHGSSVGTVVYRIVHESPEIPDSFSLAMRMIFERALAKEPSQRFPDLFSFMEGLIEAADITEDTRSRLHHYVLEVRSNAQAPPMEITQSLDNPREADLGTLQLSNPAIPGVEENAEDDPYEGRAYQTIMIPAIQMQSINAALEASKPQLLDMDEEDWMDSSHIYPPEYTEEETPNEFEEGGTRPLPIPPEFQSPASEPAPAQNVADTRPVKPPAELQTPCASESGEADTKPLECLSRFGSMENTLIIPPQEQASPIKKPTLVSDSPLIPTLTQTESTAPLPPAPPPPAPPEAAPSDFTSTETPSPNVAQPSKGGKGGCVGILLILAALIAGGTYLISKRTHGRTAAASAQGKLSIASFPVGATIYLDGQKTGKTPMYDVPIDATEHKVRIELTGYRAENRQIRAGENMVQVTLKPVGFPISLNSEPSEAEVYLNDQLMGTTPMPSLMVPSEGRQEVILRHPGYLDWQAVVDPDLPLPDPIRMNPVITRRRKSR